jgi:hypothetical protein
MLGFRHLRFLAVVLIALSLSSAAQSRHRSSSDDEDNVPKRHRHHLVAEDSGAFALGVGQLIGACKAQAADLRAMPFDAVIKAVEPNDTQLAALRQVRDAMAAAASSLAASCPKDSPARPADQLETMRTTLDAIKTALSPLRPVLFNAYAALNDEQKARLVALALSQQVAAQAAQAEQIDVHTAAVDPPSANGLQIVPLGCWQWPAMLKGWPLSRAESDMSLSDRQHAAFYVLVASIYRAAVDSEASCRSEDALTPVKRLDIKIAQLDTLSRGIDAIAPALADFVNTLNEEQKAQLNVLLGVWPQRRQTAE